VRISFHKDALEKSESECEEYSFGFRTLEVLLNHFLTAISPDISKRRRKSVACFNL
jgi:hypothetical protein